MIYDSIGRRLKFICQILKLIPLFRGMEIQQSRRLRFSYKNATIVLTIMNALFLLRGFLPFASTRTKLSLNHPNSGSSLSHLNLLATFLVQQRLFSYGFLRIYASALCCFGDLIAIHLGTSSVPICSRPGFELSPLKP